jgi:hypothetical protein
VAPARANLGFPETLEVMQMNDVEARMLAAANDRVARGAVWLDRACPGWDARLAERLDVGSWETCVLGQLSRDCDLAAEATEHKPAWLIDHGVLLEAGTLASYNDLNGAWEALIYARGARQFLTKPPLDSFDLAASAHAGAREAVVTLRADDRRFRLGS